MTEKRKLLIATDGFLPRWDGIARFLSEVIPGLKDKYDITVIAPLNPHYKGYKDEPVGYRIFRLPTYNFKIADYYAANFSKASRSQIHDLVKESDFVFVQALMPVGLMAIHFANKFEKPCIAFAHVIDWEITMNSLKIWKPLRLFASYIVKMVSRYWYKKCDLMMVPSTEVATLLDKEKINIPKVVVHLGTNTERFIPSDSKESAKIRININPDKKVIGYVGRGGEEKNIVTLHRAFKSLIKRRSDIHLLLVGPDIKSDFGEVYSDNITITGQKNNVIPYLQAMDIYVLPSLTETTSLSTLEAMSAGCAVIATKVGFVKKYIKDKQNGLFFPAKNYFVLRKKIESLLNNPDLRQELGHNARKTVILNFSWESTIGKIKEVLEEF